MSQPTKELTFDMSLADGLEHKPYIPLRYSSKSLDIKLCREIAVELLNHLTNSKFTRKMWGDRKTFKISWTDKEKQNHSVSTTFKYIVDYLFNNRCWPKQNFPPMPVSWIDSSVVMTMNFHAPANEDPNKALTFALPSSIGGSFPVIPKINREGAAFSSMQLHLQDLLLTGRKKVVVKSSQCFGLDNDWLGDLISFLNLSVSTVETTLHQIYYKAKYEGDALGWRFDEEKIGSTIGRTKDKINWVSQITGKPLGNMAREVNAFKTVKRVRNHFSHFDPPVMAYSIEDIAQWLNTTKNIAQLLWNIRRRIGVPLSLPLIEMLLCPDVEWVPRDPSKRRVPASKSDGYASCQWPSGILE